MTPAEIALVLTFGGAAVFIAVVAGMEFGYSDRAL